MIRSNLGSGKSNYGGHAKDIKMLANCGPGIQAPNFARNLISQAQRGLVALGDLLAPITESLKAPEMPLRHPVNLGQSAFLVSPSPSPQNPPYSMQHA
jgi:hypothetical protein